MASRRRLSDRLLELTDRRDAKRGVLESLFEEMRSVRKKMDDYQEDLQVLDDEIDGAEKDLSKFDDNDCDGIEEPDGDGIFFDDVLTDPGFTMTQACEILTEVENDEEEAELSMLSRKDAMERIANGSGGVNNKKVVHATAPSGLVPSKNGLKTLESYFVKPQQEARNKSCNKNTAKNPYSKEINSNSKSKSRERNRSDHNETINLTSTSSPTPVQNPYRKANGSVDKVPQQYDLSCSSPSPSKLTKTTPSLTSAPQHMTITNLTGNTLAPPTSIFALPPLQPKPALNTNTNQMYDLLNNTFGIPSFRENQEHVINTTLAGQDCFVIMRTGGGKSLTYQLPALLERPQQKVTLVVSPLLSLIHDQEQQMNRFAPASAVSITSNTKDHAARWARIRDPRSGIVMILVTPEKVSKSKRLRSELENLFQQKRLGRFVIDEAHCAAQWGHDFRPDYTELGVLKRHFPSVPLIAVTATASDRVRDDCCKILNLGSGCQFFRSTANRPNLRYEVREKRDGKGCVQDMVDFIKRSRPRGAGIIYTFSRKEADDLANQLCGAGIVARSYHSSVSNSEKEYVHSSWMRNETQVVVATIAFGLGINKPDVRFVLHHTLSKSLEGYYQESGRAGRDGNDADCVLFYSPKDISKIISMIHGGCGEHIFWSMAKYAQMHGNDAVCRQLILAHLGELGTVQNQHLDNENVEERDVTQHAKTLCNLVSQCQRNKNTVTIPQLVKKWRTEIAKDKQPNKDLNITECERCIVDLLISDVLHPSVTWANAYSSYMYIKPGPQFHNMLKDNAHAEFKFPVRKLKTATTKKLSAKSTTATASTRSNPVIPAAPAQDGWISTKKSVKKRPFRPSNSASNSTQKSAKRGRKLQDKREDIISLGSSSDDSEDNLTVIKKRLNSRLQKKDDPVDIFDDSDDDFY